MARLFTFLFLLGVACYQPLPAKAAACCTSATAFGTGRLLLWESWASGFRSQITHELGFFDDNSVYEAHGPDDLDRQIRLDAYTMIKLNEDASIFVVVPWVFPQVSSGNGIRTGSNISDIQIGYRHQVLSIGEYEELPGLALTGSFLFPTGTPKAHGTLAHDVTGRDLFAIMVGASLEKTWMPFFAQLNLGTSLLFNGIRTHNSSLGSVNPSFQLALASGMEITNDVVMSLIGSWVYESPSKWKPQLGFGASWRFNPHFTAQINVTTDLLVNGLAANWPGTFSYGFGLRYGYF